MLPFDDELRWQVRTFPKRLSEYCPRPPADDPGNLNHMVTAIIVAAGRGTRMGPNVDKLFLELAGRPVVLHTWLRFDACPEIAHVVLVTRPDL